MEPLRDLKSRVVCRGPSKKVSRCDAANLLRIDNLSRGRVGSGVEGVEEGHVLKVGSQVRTYDRRHHRYSQPTLLCFPNDEVMADFRAGLRVTGVFAGSILVVAFVLLFFSRSGGETGLASQRRGWS